MAKFKGIPCWQLLLEEEEALHLYQLLKNRNDVKRKPLTSTSIYVYEHLEDIMAELLE